MENSQLAQLLEALRKTEWRELKKFAASPFFNTHADVPRLLDFVLAERQTRKVFPSKEAIHAHLFPGQPVEVQRVRHLMSYLLKVVEKYLAVSGFLDSETDYRRHLALRNRQLKLYQNFEEHLGELRKKLAQSDLRNSEHLNELFLLEWEWYKHHTTQGRMQELNLQEISDSLDAAFISRKLRQACFMHSHQAVFKKEYDGGLFAEALRFVEATPRLLDLPAISVYFHCYRALVSPEADFFEKFKQEVFAHGQKFPPEEVHAFYLLMVNYCIRRLNQGETGYARTAFEIYKDGIGKGFLMEDGTLSRFTYHNVAACGLRVGELEWTENFIRTFRDKVEAPFRIAYFNYNLARVEYERRHFKKALTLLVSTDFQDTLHSIVAKTLELKIFYESGDFDTLHRHLDAMKVYLQRQKQLGYHRQYYLNLLQFTARLASVNFYDREQVAALRQSIENEPVLMEKEWLVKQLESLK